MLDENQEDILRRLKQSDGRDFGTLVKLAELDPTKDLREADLRGVDFGTTDLRGFDFSGADLTGANLGMAKIEDAIFERAITRDVIWPAPLKMASLQNTARPQLRPVQLRILQTIQRALSSPSPRGGLVSMPAGTGRIAIIEELLVELSGSELYHNVLIVVESAAERHQILARLTKLATSRRHESYSTTSRIGLGTVDLEVVTLGIVSSILKGRSRISAEHIMGADLVITLCTPGNLVNLTEMLGISHRAARPIVAFTTLPYRHGSSAMERQTRQLEDVLDGILYYLSFDEALDERLLVQATVEHYQSTALTFATGKSEIDIDYQLRHLAHQITERSWSGHCLTICRDVETVELATSRLTELLDGVSSKRVFSVSSRSLQPELWRVLGEQEAVLVMTQAMALSATEQAIWNSGLIALLTTIGQSLEQRLRFKPPRGNRSPDVIIDYIGSLE